MESNGISTISPSQGTVFNQRLFIWVTFQRKGFHCYPHAPEDVAYLQDRHRHLFKFRVKVSVPHEEREIEFHQFLNWLESLYDSGNLEASGKSCETLAKELCSAIMSKYPNRVVEVEVSEDGECGSIVICEPMAVGRHG